MSDDSMTDADEAPDLSQYADQGDGTYDQPSDAAYSSDQFGDWDQGATDPLAGAFDDLAMFDTGADEEREEEDEEREEEDEEREEDDEEREEDDQESSDAQDDDEEEDEEREEEDQDREEEDEEREEDDEVEMYDDETDG